MNDYTSNYSKEKISVILYICIPIVLGSAIYLSTEVYNNYKTDDKGNYINDRSNYLYNLVFMILLWIVFLILTYIFILYIFGIDRWKLFQKIKYELCSIDFFDSFDSCHS